MIKTKKIKEIQNDVESSSNFLFLSFTSFTSLLLLLFIAFAFIEGSLSIVIEIFLKKTLILLKTNVMLLHTEERLLIRMLNSSKK
jgi:hypothetical protein